MLGHRANLQTLPRVAWAQQLIEHQKIALEGKIEVRAAQFSCPRSREGCAGSSVGAGLTPPPALAHTHWASGPGAHTEFNSHMLCDGAANGCCLNTSTFGVLCSSLV